MGIFHSIRVVSCEDGDNRLNREPACSWTEQPGETSSAQTVYLSLGEGDKGRTFSISDYEKGSIKIVDDKESDVFTISCAGEPDSLNCLKFRNPAQPLAKYSVGSFASYEYQQEVQGLPQEANDFVEGATTLYGGFRTLEQEALTAFEAAIQSGDFRIEYSVLTTRSSIRVFFQFKGQEVEAQIPHYAYDFSTGDKTGSFYFSLEGVQYRFHGVRVKEDIAQMIYQALHQKQLEDIERSTVKTK